jgi:prepilin-type N-terminal cleavage/methylation domain-containing protein
MKTPSRRHPAAFTLIELMAVITIIVILAGIVIGGMGYVNEKQARSKAQVQIGLLSKALEEFKLDMGKYPGTADNTGIDGTGVTPQLYTELFYEGYDYSKQSNPSTWEKTVSGVKVPKATRIYLPELDPTSSKQGWVDPATDSTPPASRTIKDPWGTEYRYRKGSNAQNPDFDLWSCGKDAQTDTSNPSMTSAKNKDDIRNF